MSSYNGRKPINVSRYIADLNAIPSANDVIPQNETDSSIEDDLARFTNTEFLDFDFLDSSQFDPEQQSPAKGENGIENGKYNGKALDFENGMPTNTPPSFALSKHQKSRMPCAYKRVFNNYE